MPLDEPILPRDAACPEASAGKLIAQKILLNVHTQQRFELAGFLRQLQQGVIQRRARRRRHEPVRPDHGDLGTGQLRYLRIQVAQLRLALRVIAQPIGIRLDDFGPEVFLVPVQIANVENEDGLFLVDGLGHGDAQLPAQAVDGLGQRCPVRAEVGVGNLRVVVQVGQREIPQERAGAHVGGHHVIADRRSGPPFG